MENPIAPIDILYKAKSSLGLSQTGDSAPDTDRILSLFGGHQQNAQYFLELWCVVQAMNKEGLQYCPCDPRDERKRNYMESWKPPLRKCPVDAGCFELDGESIPSEGTFAVKQTVLEQETKEKDSSTNDGCSGDGPSKRFHCGVYGCGEVLSSLASYEAHYRHRHNYVCATCRRVFVSDFLLDIHLQENHDSYFAVLSPRIDMYRCLVESCVDKFRTPEMRKDHLVSVHKFPSNFSFHQPVKENRCQGSGKRSDITEDGRQPIEMEISSSLAPDEDRLKMDVEGARSTTPSSVERNEGQRGQMQGQSKRVPASICFGRGSQRTFATRGRGRGRGRGGRERNWYQTKASMEMDTAVDIESVDMMELATALT